jgi:BirA family transcriptional regulator, biotin operon repressor / biotin---[acetyl-CoA-carboxylase] ligase
LQKFFFDTVDSTQNKISELLYGHQITPPFYVAAKQQSAGRGSLGKSWVSPEGNVYWSGVFTMPKTQREERFKNFPFHLFAGATVRNLLEKISGHSGFRLKWPNDILLNEKKIAGVLCETGEVNDGFYVIFGVGINRIQPQVQAPGGLPVTSFADHHLLTVSVAEFSEALGDAFLYDFNRLQTDADYGQADWEKYFAYLHQPVQVIEPNGCRMIAVPVGFYEDGSLRVQAAGQEMRVINASLRPVPPAETIAI